MLAPPPSTQASHYIAVDLLEGACAVPIVKVVAPSLELPIDLQDDLFQPATVRAPVEFLPKHFSEFLHALRVRFDVRIPFLTPLSSAPHHLKSQEPDSFLA